jgi:serine/threonine-protein kinase RsbW
MSEPLSTEKMVILSMVDELERVDQATDRIAASMGFSDDARADLGICVTEAVNNAIGHAHQYKAELPIEIEFKCYAESLHVCVRDHGAGFDVEGLPDPTSPENILKDHGRGVLLIRALMDAVVVHRLADGMLIELIKKLHGRGDA